MPGSNTTVNYFHGYMVRSKVAVFFLKYLNVLARAKFAETTQDMQKVGMPSIKNALYLKLLMAS